MDIIYTSKFFRAYKKLPKEIKQKAQDKETLFRKNPFDSKLKTHKLEGDLGDFWSFSIDSKHRIIFEIGKKDKYYFHMIGNHDIY
jgi:mRNA-degrading endonuclease YafQ of YafQ-DinJ toxin-antitoxin module